MADILIIWGQSMNGEGHQRMFRWMNGIKVGVKNVI